MAARILAIDDNHTNLELVRYLLEHAGHTVAVASDGAQGLAAARSARPDLVITDLGMPVMNGYELLAALREDPALRTLRVVALSAYSMESDREKVMRAGFDGYLSKPLDPESFAREIETFLRGSAP